MSETLLSIDQLSVQFGKAPPVVERLSLTLSKGKTLAIVGESGSGKSLTALSILGLLPENASVSGKITYQGEDIRQYSEKKMQSLRGNRIAMIFQEPLTALNPLQTVGQQIAEMFTLHQDISVSEAEKRCLELLQKVGIDAPQRRLSAYPHQLSGGQRQRVMIAMALANEPDVLIADEPTTALDVTIQAQILNLLQKLQQEMGLTILFITHDLNIVRQIAHDICVMQSGKNVEYGSCDAVFKIAQHPYTQALLAAEPQGQPLPVPKDCEAVLEIKNLSVKFPMGKRHLFAAPDFFTAVNDVSFSVKAGETLGIVGESGSGKTSLGLALMRLVAAQGSINFQGHSVLHLSGKALKSFRSQAQIVFQDPFGSLSPRLSVAEIIQEGLRLHRNDLTSEELDQAVCQALEDVHLDPQMRFRYPHEFSGGQRQRISMARALILSPKFIILDEPTSALDRLVQKDLCILLRDLQAKYQISFIFISHDLEVVRSMSHRICVLYAGEIVEQGDVTQIYQKPQHAYTQLLLSHTSQKGIV